MLKGHSVIGKKVLSRLDGQKIDSTKDIVISKDHRRIVAFILEEGGLFSAATAVAMENIVSFGKDAIIITDSKAVVRVEHFPAVKEIMDDRDGLVGKQVFSESGDLKGKIEDIYFDETNGDIIGLELVGKFNPKGQNTAVQLKMSDIVSIGPDAVVITTASVPTLEAQAAGGAKPLDTVAAVNDLQNPSTVSTSPSMSSADPGSTSYARLATEAATTDMPMTSEMPVESSIPTVPSEATVQLPSDPDQGSDR